MAVTFGEATLTLPPTDVDGDGQDETGVFHFATNATIAFETRTGRIGGMSRLNSLFSGFVEDQLGVDLSGSGKRQQVYTDLGDGEHVVEINFQGYTGSTHRWGDSGNGGTAADATGEPVNRQMELLDRYLQLATIDSRPGNEAYLEIGNYSEDGYYAPLVVAPEQPRVEFDATEESSTFDGSLTFVEIASLSDPVAATSRTEK